MVCSSAKDLSWNEAEDGDHDQEHVPRDSSELQRFENRRYMLPTELTSRVFLTWLLQRPSRRGETQKNAMLSRITDVFSREDNARAHNVKIVKAVTQLGMLRGKGNQSS